MTLATSRRLGVPSLRYRTPASRPAQPSAYRCSGSAEFTSAGSDGRRFARQDGEGSSRDGARTMSDCLSRIRNSGSPSFDLG